MTVLSVRVSWCAGAVYVEYGIRCVWHGAGAVRCALCSVEAEPGVCTGYSAHDSAIFKATAEQTDYRESVRQSCVSTFQGLMGVHTGASPIYGSQSFP